VEGPRRRNGQMLFPITPISGEVKFYNIAEEAGYVFLKRYKQFGKLLYLSFNVILTMEAKEWTEKSQ
jgi:hypothetical protein